MANVGEGTSPDSGPLFLLAMKYGYEIQKSQHFVVLHLYDF